MDRDDFKTIILLLFILSIGLSVVTYFSSDKSRAKSCTMVKKTSNEIIKCMQTSGRYGARNCHKLKLKCEYE